MVQAEEGAAEASLTHPCAQCLGKGEAGGVTREVGRKQEDHFIGAVVNRSHAAEGSRKPGLDVSLGPCRPLVALAAGLLAK